MNSTLATARLDLRPLRLADLDAAHQLWTDPEVRRFLWDGEVIPLERAADVLAASERDFAEAGFGLWGIRPQGDRTLVGFAGLRRGELLPEPELLFGLLPAWWGKGFAVEGAAAVLAHGFGALGLRWIGAATDQPNRRSIQVLARLGMRYTRRATVHGLDTVFYRLGRHEWRVRTVRGDGRGPPGVKICCIASLEEARLAGGLTPENVANAVAAVRPFGLDVCSGVHESGRLSPRRLAAFFEVLADGGVAHD